jgi:hypothetical protein
MRTRGIRLLQRLSITSALLVLAGCEQLSASLGVPIDEQQDSPSTKQAVIIGEPVVPAVSAVAEEAANPGQAAPNVAVSAALGPQVEVSAAFPPDGPEYQAHLMEVKAATQSGSPGRLVGVPTKVSANGYPIYPASCIFYPEHAECELADGEVVDEGYLQAHTTVIRNVDVLHGGMTCGIVCIDEQGNVLGHVSRAMQAWRDQHCRWVDYGTASCE